MFASSQISEAGPAAIAPRLHLSTLVRRAAILLLVLGGEALLGSIFLDTGALENKGGALTGLIRHQGPWAVRAALVFGALFVTFAYLKYGPAVARAAAGLERVPISRKLILGHCIALSAFAVLSAVLFGNEWNAIPRDAVAALWLTQWAAAVLSIALALAPATFWRDLLRGTGRLWAYASAGSICACAVGFRSWKLWKYASDLTFSLVRMALNPFVAHVVAHPDTKEIGTPTFTVVIERQCSGLEGIGLFLIFSVCWLLLFRSELRFPRALVLIPAAIVTLFLMNSVRITALILIGNAGAPEIAVGGFHSQAGWIAFNSVAVATAVAARRLRFFAAPGSERLPSARPAESPATAAYLLPFLAIVAAGMLARAMSGNFEWMYWLRFPAALAALLAFRHDYPRPAWKPDWCAPLVGAGVFLLWLALDRALVAPSADALPALAAASPALRVSWLAARIAGAVTIVPVAEELAFRGYLLRRLTAADFERVGFAAVTLLALLGSSLAFGLMHGRLWPAGIVAGIAYAIATRRRGSLGDAIIAHATTNALLAVYVVMFGQWHLW